MKESGFFKKIIGVAGLTALATGVFSKDAPKNTVKLEQKNQIEFVNPEQEQVLLSSLDQMQKQYESVIVEKNEVEKDFKAYANAYLTILDRKFQTLPKSEQKQFEVLYNYPKAIKHLEELRAERKNTTGADTVELDEQVKEAKKLVDDLDALSGIYSDKFGLDTPIKMNDFWSANVNHGAENRNDEDTHKKFGHYPQDMREAAPSIAEKEIEANKKAEIIAEAKTAMAKINKANQNFAAVKLTEKEMTALNAIGLDTSQTSQESEATAVQKPTE